MAPPKPVRAVELVVDNFGHIQNNANYLPIKRFTWKNVNRVQVQAITYGATITSIKYPNKKGIVDDVIVGFDEMNGYLEHQEYYFGIIGRVSNYIKNGTFTINKKEFSVTKNMSGHHYNGGDRGFNTVIWEYYVSGNKVVLSHVSPDNDEGYPGVLMVFVSYELTYNSEFKVEIKAYSNKMTICNLTSSIYFNLAGHGNGADELGKHELVINADCMTCTNEDLTSTGEIKSVYGTMFDLRIPVKLSSLLDKYGGVNTNFCINRGVNQDSCFVLRLTHAESGRLLEIYSNQYGVNIETGNNFPVKALQVEVPVKSKNPYLKNAVSTFDLLDEIYCRVHDVLNVDKTMKYNELLRLIRDLQKKDTTLYRTSSSSALFRNDKNISGNIKRSKINFDNLPVQQLSPIQVKYIERIVEKMDTVTEPHHLAEIREVLGGVLQKASFSKDESWAKSVSFDKADDYLTKEFRGKKGARYTKHCAINFETQNYPDAINQPNFPNCILKPGGVYTHTIVYRFFVKNTNVGCTGYI